MARIQLALDVTDLERATAFYEKLLGVAPAKRRPGYANFVVADPPLKLALFESATGGRVNHLGVEVSSGAEVEAASERFGHLGLAKTDERGVACCYAVQDKVWVADPDGVPWEVYTVLSDSEQLSPGDPAAAGEERAAVTGACC